MTRLLHLHLLSQAELQFDRSSGTNFLALFRSSVFVGGLKVQTEEPESGSLSQLKDSGPGDDSGR